MSSTLVQKNKVSAAVVHAEGFSHALEHQLGQHFPELLKFESTPEMEASELYKKIKPEVERILNAVVVQSSSRSEQAEARTQNVSAVAWNIERGIQLDGIIDALKNHPGLHNTDLLLLTELDYGMARSGNRFVAKEIADAARDELCLRAGLYRPAKRQRCRRVCRRREYKFHPWSRAVFALSDDECSCRPAAKWQGQDVGQRESASGTCGLSSLTLNIQSARSAR